MESHCLGYISDWTTGVKEGLEQPFPELPNLFHEDSERRPPGNRTTWGDSGGSTRPEPSIQRRPDDTRGPAQN